MFKLELEVEKNGEEKKEMKKPSPLQKRVAQIIARQNGRKKPNEMDMMRAAKVEEEENGD